jgi:hypothetical protein
MTVNGFCRGIAAVALLLRYLARKLWRSHNYWVIQDFFRPGCLRGPRGGFSVSWRSA